MIVNRDDRSANGASRRSAMGNVTSRKKLPDVVASRVLRSINMETNINMEASPVPPDRGHRRSTQRSADSFGIAWASIAVPIMSPSRDPALVYMFFHQPPSIDVDRQCHLTKKNYHTFNLMRPPDRGYRRSTQRSAHTVGMCVVCFEQPVC